MDFLGHMARTCFMHITSCSNRMLQSTHAWAHQGQRALSWRDLVLVNMETREMKLASSGLNCFASFGKKFLACAHQKESVAKAKHSQSLDMGPRQNVLGFQVQLVCRSADLNREELMRSS